MTETQWRVLDLPSGVAVEHLSDVFPGVVSISGLRDGIAYAVEAKSNGELTEILIPPEVAARGSARVLKISSQGLLGVCGATGLWGRPRDDRGENGAPQVFEVPRDENGAEAVWLWVTAGDGNLQSTAAYPTTQGHEIRVLDTDRHQPLPVEHPLVTSTPLSEIHVAAFAGRVTAAGPIADPDTLTAWWATSSYPGPDDYRHDPLPWRSNAFEGSPALITDGSDWDGMSFYAGVNTDGAVALWDAMGELRESTDVLAHPSDPVALIAEIDGWGDFGEGEGPGGLAAMAIRSSRGNVLSFTGDEYDMPSGRLRSVVLNRGFDLARCFALIDDDIYVADLEYRHF